MATKSQFEVKENLFTPSDFRSERVSRQELIVHADYKTRHEGAGTQMALPKFDLLKRGLREQAALVTVAERKSNRTF
jgi:hypothetical protein